MPLKAKWAAGQDSPKAKPRARFDLATKTLSAQSMERSLWCDPLVGMKKYRRNFAVELARYLSGMKATLCGLFYFDFRKPDPVSRAIAFGPGVYGQFQLRSGGQIESPIDGLESTVRRIIAWIKIALL